MLAQWYPPCQAWPTAATRARLLATQLPEHGWRPLVLVPDMTGGACRCGWCADASRPAPADAPGVTVHRLPVRPSRVRQALALARRTGPQTGHSPAPSTAPGPAQGRAAEVLWLLGDVHSNWPRLAAKHADRLLARGGVDAIWTTSAPFAHVRLADRLAHRYDLPWVADLRDPVSTDVTAPPGVLERAVRARRRTYRQPLLRATAITAATGQVAELDGPWLGREPVVLVPGFDQAEWAAARSNASPSADRFEVVFTGKLYESYRRPDTFLRGLRHAADQLAPADRDRLRFVYYGRSGDFLRELAERYGCADLVEDRGFVRPDTVPVLLTGAGALLLLTNDAGDSGVPGGKFFEYLAAHRPVLAVPGADRYVADVLSRTGSGRLAQDEHEVSDTLLEWFAAWRTTGHLPFTGDASAIDDFSAATSAARLADLLSGGLADHPGAAPA
jgi:hypothetical protein